MAACAAIIHMKTLLVIDGNNVAKRAEFAVPPLSSASGVPTNVARGFLSILASYTKMVQPTHIYVVFDHPAKTDKHIIYADYKANRTSSSTDDFRQQLLLLRKLLPKMGVRVYRKKGIEGDEVVATLAVKFARKGSVYIASNDKDFASLVTDNVFLLKPDKIFDADAVEATWGVPPSKMVDYLMLLGDKVDNIPGVEKCGPKTAAKWLANVSSVNDIPKQPGVVGANLEKARKHFKLTRRLIELNTEHDIPLKKPCFRAREALHTLNDLGMASSITMVRSIMRQLGHN